MPEADIVANPAAACQEPTTHLELPLQDVGSAGGDDADAYAEHEPSAAMSSDAADGADQSVAADLIEVGSGGAASPASQPPGEELDSVHAEGDEYDMDDLSAAPSPARSVQGLDSIQLDGDEYEMDDLSAAPSPARSAAWRQLPQPDFWGPARSGPLDVSQHALGALPPEG